MVQTLKDIWTKLLSESVCETGTWNRTWCFLELRVMDRDLSSCAHDSRSSDTKSGSDGGNREGPGAVAGISGFRILDVHNLHVGEDGTDLEPGTGFSLTGDIYL